MKRILIYSLSYHPFIGGAEIAIKEITDRISPGDIEFDMVTLRYDRSLPRVEKVGNVTVHRIGFSMNNPTMEDLVSFPMYLNKVLFPLMALYKGIVLHRARPYHAVWAMMSYMGFPALLLRLFTSLPMLLTLQEGDTVAHITKRWRIRAVYPLYRRIFKTASKVQAISRYLAHFARQMGYTGVVEVIPNGVDVEAFAREYSEQELGTLRWEFHKQPGDIFLVTVSRLVEKNGIADVIRALTLLPNHVRFLVIGPGPRERELKELAQGLGVAERVHFIGSVEYKDVPRFLKISDIFIRPSLSEGMGNSFIEAMAAGIPVIATPVGGIPDFLTDRVTGVFCKVNDPESIAVSVNKIIDSDELRAAITRNAKRLVAEHYDWEGVAKAMHQKVFS